MVGAMRRRGAFVIFLVALLFGAAIGLGTRAAEAAPPSSVSTAVRASAPSGDCLRRFLGPIEHLAGMAPERPQKSADTTDALPSGDWLAAASRDVSALRST